MKSMFFGLSMRQFLFSMLACGVSGAGKLFSGYSLRFTGFFDC